MDSKKRWSIVGFIWAGAIFFTIWNMHLIEVIRQTSEQKAIFERDAKYQKDNAENIANTLRRRAAAFHTVESVKFGLLVIENHLKSQSEAYGLIDMEMISHLEKANQGSVPVTLTFFGSMGSTLQWMDVLKKEYPYLPVNQVNISVDHLAKRIKYKISFTYRYNLIAPGNTSTAILSSIFANRIIV
jgi:hypothetical protein